MRAEGMDSRERKTTDSEDPPRFVDDRRLVKGLLLQDGDGVLDGDSGQDGQRRGEVENLQCAVPPPGWEPGPGTGQGTNRHTDTNTRYVTHVHTLRHNLIPETSLNCNRREY